MGTGCFATPKIFFFFLPKSVASCSCRVIVFREGHFRNGATNVRSPHRPVQLITISAHKKTRDKRLKERDGAVGGMLSWRNAIFCLQPKGHQTASPPTSPHPSPGCCQRPPRPCRKGRHILEEPARFGRNCRFAHSECAPSTQIYQLNE